MLSKWPIFNKGKEIECHPVLEEGWKTQVCISSDGGVPG